MDLTKALKWVVGAVAVLVFVLLCCIVGLFAKPMTPATTSAPTVVSSPTVVFPTDIPTAVPTVDKIALCKNDVIKWKNKIGSVISLTTDSMKALADNQSLDTAKSIYLNAVSEYQAIIVPTCDAEVELANLRIGMMLLETGKALDSKTIDEFQQHINEANNWANQVIGLMDVINARYDLK